MIARQGAAAPSHELGLAIGLVWGHLRAGQHEAAWQLARGCLRVWPDDARLASMAAYAQTELYQDVDPAILDCLERLSDPRWAALVRRRAYAP